MANNKTLAYSQENKGWTSFFSYVPDRMLGMNGRFYSFKGGNIWEHDKNSTYNNFYGTQYNSTVDTVINQNPFEQKLFKTLSLESDTAWSIGVTSDTDNVGTIDAAWFKKKENTWYAFIRNVNTNSYDVRSVQGLGVPSSIDKVGFFETCNLNSVDTIISIGDTVLYAESPSYVPVSAGTITAKTDTSVTVQTSHISDQQIKNGAMVLVAKNVEAESQGVLGHYINVALENSSTTRTELFAIESNVMKSNP